MQIRFTRFIIIVLLVALVNVLLIFTVSGTVNQPAHAAEQVIHSLEEGDLVFRTGNGVISDWFRRCCLTDPVYSHAGVLVKKGGENYVVHMEQSSANGAIRMEKLSTFWGDQCCKGGAVYRLDLDDSERMKMKSEILTDVTNGVVFDPQFNLDEDAKMYCSEWIRNKVIHATEKPDYFPISVADDFRYIAPDNLYINHHAVLIYKFMN